MATVQTILQGQGVGQQIGGVSAATQERVQESIARQQQNGGGNGTGSQSGTSTTIAGVPTTGMGDWSSMAWLILGML